MKRQIKKGFLGILIALATMAIALFAGGCKNVNVDEWFCDHKYNDGTVIVDAGCTTDGALERTCTSCGKKKKEPILAVGHDFDEGEVVLAPSCTVTGVKEYTCSRCGEVNTETVQTIPHNEIVFAGTPATCTETGMTEGRKCSTCNTVLVAQSVIPAKGHKRVDDFAVSPTCTTTGLTYGYHCERCDEQLLLQEVIPALGHDVVTLVGYPATCTDDGLTNGAKCNRCNTVYTEQEEIAALGHNTVTIAGHSATCTETGLTDKEYCARCNTVYAAQAVIGALGHIDSDNDGYCERCFGIVSMELVVENSSLDTLTEVSTGEKLETGVIYCLTARTSDKAYESALLSDGNIQINVCPVDGVFYQYLMNYSTEISVWCTSNCEFDEDNNEIYVYDIYFLLPNKTVSFNQMDDFTVSFDCTNASVISIPEGLTLSKCE